MPPYKPIKRTLTEMNMLFVISLVGFRGNLGLQDFTCLFFWMGSNKQMDGGFPSGSKPQHGHPKSSGGIFVGWGVPSALTCQTTGLFFPIASALVARDLLCLPNGAQKEMHDVQLFQTPTLAPGSFWLLLPLSVVSMWFVWVPAGVFFIFLTIEPPKGWFSLGFLTRGTKQGGPKQKQTQLFPNLSQSRQSPQGAKLLS